MKRSGVLLLTMCLFVAGCDEENGDKGGPSDQPLVFTANMTAAQETTAVGGGEQNATGTATVTITPTRDSSGAITGGTARLQFSVSSRVIAQDVEVLLQIAIRVAAAVGAVESGAERSLADELADVESGLSQPLDHGGHVPRKVVAAGRA